MVFKFSHQKIQKIQIQIFSQFNWLFVCLPTMAETISTKEQSDPPNYFWFRTIIWIKNETVQQMRECTLNLCNSCITYLLIARQKLCSFLFILSLSSCSHRACICIVKMIIIIFMQIKTQKWNEIKSFGCGVVHEWCQTSRRGRRVGLKSVTVYANFCYGRCKNPKLR